MAALFDYLLQANAVLLLFAAAYYGLLRRLTFFQLNRAYLLLALLFAAIYPALPVPALLPAPTLLLPAATAATGTSPVAYVASTHSLDYKALAISVYAFGTGLLLLRLLGQLVSLALVRSQSRPALVLGQAVRVLAGAGGPFSFGRTIYLSEATLTDAANLAPALRHEQAHVRQLHTVDVLLAQLATALAWANPAAWLLRRAVLDNLEYLADHAALQTGLDRRAYQYSLLRHQPGGVPAPALAFHVDFLTLKNRITMLNQPASPTRQLGRYLVAALLVLALALGYSAAHAQVVPTPAPAPKAAFGKPTYYVDGKVAANDAISKMNPDEIASITVLKDAAQLKVLGPVAAGGAVLITTKTNANSPEVLAFNNRFPVTPATAEQNAAIAAVQAYMAKNYPTAKLSIVAPARGQANRYQAVFTAAGQRQQLLFDGQGHPVAQ